MDGLKSRLKALSKSYDRKEETLGLIEELTRYCLSKLEPIEAIPYNSLCEKNYHVLQEGSDLSRPFLPELLIRDPDTFSESWASLVENAEPTQHRINATSECIDQTLYSSTMAVALCFDLWANKSRKTPGTFFEILLGSIIGYILPEHERTKFVSLPAYGEKVTTDIVFDKGSKGIVIPAKISTRERVVQPYAHQRILDAVKGEGRYTSVLMSVSETQRDDNKITTNDICVPGTIKLFQQHLAKLGGLYYLDPPVRYLAADLTEIIPVSTIGAFLSLDLKVLVDQNANAT